MKFDFDSETRENLLNNYREVAELALYAGDSPSPELQKKASEALDAEFIAQIRLTFNWKVSKSAYFQYEQAREKILNFKKPLDLVEFCMYSPDEKEFLEENWDDLDFIIQQLQAYVREIMAAEEEAEAAAEEAAKESGNAGE